MDGHDMTMTKRWWDLSFTVADLTEDEAQTLLDQMLDLACAGTGDGDDHVCARDVVASLRPTPEEDQ